MQSETEKNYNNNSYQNINIITFKAFIEKLDSININEENQFTNYPNKLLAKFPFLKNYIKTESNQYTKAKEIIGQKNPKIKKQKIAIIYHHPCFDGCYSAVNAFIYYTHFSNKINSIDFFPMTNSQRLEEILGAEMLIEYKKIFLFDKGFNEDDFQFLYETINIHENNKISGNSMIVVDHHVSSTEIFFKDFYEIFKEKESIAFVFDKEEKRSACGITYEFFHAKALRKFKLLLDNKEIQLLNEKFEIYKKYFSDEYQKLIEFVEDTDTGNFLLDYTNEFKSGLNNYIYPLNAKCDFRGKKINNIKLFLEVNVDFCIKSGMKSYAIYKNKAINEISKDNNVFLVRLPKNISNRDFSTKKTLIAHHNYMNNQKDDCELDKENYWYFLACYTNTVHLRNYGAIVLSELSEIKGYDPIGAFIYYKEKDFFKISMRTHSEKTDLCFISKCFGGGGHTKAASFMETTDFINNIRLKPLNISNDIKILLNSKIHK